MSVHRRITSRDKPETIARTAALYEEHLRLALGIALRRAARSMPLVRELLSSATIEGLASRLNTKTSAVSFHVPQLKQTWHQLYSWQFLAGNSVGETATWIASSLRESIRRSFSDH
jgi:hypothetical protein